MTQLTYNSIRIFKQDKSTFSVKELESLKSFIFNSPVYFTHNFRFVSRFTPLIFSLTDNDTSIEAQFNTYGCALVRENIDRLYEMTFPYYQFWFIEAGDDVCVDKIGSYSSISVGGNDIASTNRSSWRDCLYAFDCIAISGDGPVPASLSHIEFERRGDQLISRGYSGVYCSYSEKNFTDGQRYKLIPEEHQIGIEKKYDEQANGIRPVSLGYDYYSDANLRQFIHDELRGSGLTEIRFYHRSRLTRIVSADKPQLVTAFDGWDNCADPEYLQFAAGKKQESITSHLLMKHC